MQIITYIYIIYSVLCLLSCFAVHKSLGKTALVGFIAISGFILYCTFYFWKNGLGNGSWSLPQQLSFGVLLSWAIAMLVISSVVITEQAARLLAFPVVKHLPARRKFVSDVALALGAVPLAGLLYGMVKGKYNYQIRSYTLSFPDLPLAFDGYKIAHLSDIHCGSFDNREKVQYGIDLLNAQNADMVCLTGDIVNNTAAEIENWRSIFSQIKARDGVYSVLGNHDYGDYVKWPSVEQKAANLARLKNLQSEMGFRLLLNEAIYIRKQKDKIAIVGVENWGDGFIKKGDLSKALLSTQKDDFKILLSHDPTHWQHKVLEENAPIQLTLSGHTHGMQMGIEIPNIVRWSPVSIRYKYWGGMYQEEGKYLNVNTGFGYHAYPGRVGMPPEISIITLKRG